MTTTPSAKRAAAPPGPQQAAVRRILVVDDEAAVRRLLRTLFEGEGYAVSEAASEIEVLAQLSRPDVALITLDLSLGGEDGLAVARAVRARSAVPIIMVTAKGDEVDRIVGLELGADDYIAKPFNLREVLARVRAVLRRADVAHAAVTQVQQGHGPHAQLGAQSDDAVVHFAGYTLDTGARDLRNSDGTRVDLSTNEFKLLEAFVRRAGRVLSRDQLIDLVAGRDADPLQRAIDTLVGRLRRKIEPNAATPELIKTVRGAGYVFTAKVQGG